jgi:hypothetical protein
VDLETLLKRLEALEAGNAELRARLAKYEKQDSSNSNQPPSTDRFKKNQSLRKNLVINLEVNLVTKEQLATKVQKLLKLFSATQTLVLSVELI